MGISERFAEMPMSAPRKMILLWTVLGVLALSGIGALLHKAWPILFPRVVASAPVDPGCDLRAGPCVGFLPGGGAVRLAIEPRTIPVLRPLGLTVRLDGVQARGVEVDFTGTDMNMGYNRVALRREAPGQWSGRGMLPVCVRDVMSWEARVLVDTGDGLVAAPFRFDTYRERSSD
jgi:hypothetical protein